MTTTIAHDDVEVTLGVDTHKDIHVAAAFDQLGRLFETRAFPATGDGYTELCEWAWSNSGPVVEAGVEGTGSWGAWAWPER